jgi:hypothetical protein
VASLSSIAWDVVRVVVILCLVVCGVGWLVEWRKGQRTLRDARGRPKPAVALALVVGGLLAVGALVSSAS